MLQDNVPRDGRRAHLAHAALIGLHAVCCGAPAAAALAVALAGAASAAALLAQPVGVFHALLHAHELWIVAVSALLVAVGGAYEAGARRNGGQLGFPWLYTLSVAFFVANLAIVALHRG